MSDPVKTTPNDFSAAAAAVAAAATAAGPVTVGTCGCSNNFGHTCEEVARLRAENAEIRGDNATLGSTVTGLRADNVTLRDLLAKAFPWIDDNDSHDDYLLTVAIREALGEGS